MDDESNLNFIQVPLPRMQKKGQTNILHPAVILTILQVVMKKLLKVQAWEKRGQKLKLVKKKKAKKMEKENDLVESSQGSDSQLSEAGNK